MSDAQREPSEAVKRLRWAASQPEIEAIADDVRDAIDGKHTAEAISALLRVTGECLALATPAGQEQLLAAVIPALRDRIKIATAEKRGII
jgi:hypothetical protein